MTAGTTRGGDTARPTVHAIALPTPFEIGRVNVYLLPDRPTTLVDTGPNTARALAALEAGLSAIGTGVEAVERVVVTHGHADHCGLAGQIQSLSGAEVVGHPAVARALTDYGEHWAGRTRLLQRAARAADVPTELAEAAVEAEAGLAALGSDVAPGRATGIAGDRPVRAGGAVWRLMHTPGHTADHVSLVHERSGTAFTGDLMLRHLQTVPHLEPGASGQRPDTMGDLIASWRRLGRTPLRIAYPGHGRAVRAHRVLIARRLVWARNRLGAARDAVGGGASTLWDVVTVLGPPGTPAGLPAALGEAAGLLDWWVRRGKMARQARDGIVRYAPMPPPRR